MSLDVPSNDVLTQSFGWHLTSGTAVAYLASPRSAPEASQRSTWWHDLRPTYTSSGPQNTYEEASFDSGLYTNVLHASEDPKSFPQLAIYAPQAPDSDTKLRPPHEYAQSPVDSYSSGSSIASTSGFEKTLPDLLLYISPSPVNNSRYSELAHALGEPSPPPLPPVVEVARFKPEPTNHVRVHPADLDEPPMAFLQPDSPRGVPPSVCSSIPIEPAVLDSPIDSPSTPQWPEQIPVAGGLTSTNIQDGPAPSRAKSHRMTTHKGIAPRLNSPESIAALSSPLTPASTPNGPAHATIPRDPLIASSKVDKKKRSHSAAVDSEDEDAEGFSWKKSRFVACHFCRGRNTQDEDAEGSSRRKKPSSVACHFCRGRKIRCDLPGEDAEDKRCKQCAKRSMDCEMPAESRRGRYGRKSKDKAQESDTSGDMSKRASRGLAED